MPSARTTVIERAGHQNMEAEQRRKSQANAVAPPGCRGVLAALAALHEKKHATAEYLATCCNLPRASARHGPIIIPARAL